MSEYHVRGIQLLPGPRRLFSAGGHLSCFHIVAAPRAKIDETVLLVVITEQLGLQDSASGRTDLGNPRRVTEIMRIHGYAPTPAFTERRQRAVPP